MSTTPCDFCNEDHPNGVTATMVAAGHPFTASDRDNGVFVYKVGGSDEEPEPSDTAPLSDEEPAARPCCPECYGGPTVGCAEGGDCLCHRGGR